MGVGIGLIGCGRIASAVHLQVLRRVSGADLVAVSDPDPRARERGRQARGAAIYEGADELLADSRVDAVVICAPSGEHAQLTVAAAEAGKHVYVEKPIATSVADATAAIAAAERAGIIAVAGFNRRSHPIFEQGRRLLANGSIGPVRAVQTAFCEPLSGASLPDWKRRRGSGGGVLLDLGSHHFDLLRWLLGQEIESVVGSLRSDESEHDGGWVRVGLEGGVEARCFFSFRSGRADFLEFIGDQGVLRLDRYRPPALLFQERGAVPALRRVRIRPSPAQLAWRARAVVRPAHEPSFRRSLVRFVRLLNGERVELPTLEDGLRSLEAVLAAEKSALV